MSWQTLYQSWSEAIRPPRRLKPSEWADANRYLTSHTAAEPGKYSTSRTPYVRGVIDSVAEPGIEEIVWVAGTQVGKTAGEENLIGYWIDNDPGPLLIVRPSEAGCEEYSKERLRPLIESSPALARHLSPAKEDNSIKSIRLDSMPIYMGWAGSPASLASRPCRYVVFDEVDKFPPFSGREADPISLASERQATYLHRKRTIMVSTPTTPDGAIWVAFQKCPDKRWYHVPCAKCGVYQKLVWSQVKWDKLNLSDEEHAEKVEREGLAWYECSHCKARLTHADKLRMIQRGAWASEGQTVLSNGTLHGDKPTSKRVGFHLSSLYSPWRSFSEMAAEFLRAKGDLGAMMNFRNSRLAEPFENVVAKTDAEVIRVKCATAHTPGHAPDWTQLVACTADTQQDWFRVTIRAWGYNFRSQGLWEGRCESFEELMHLAFDSRFAFGKSFVSPSCLLIDTGGSRTNEVYQFALRDPRIIPCKGANQTGRRPWWINQLPTGVMLRMIDVHYFKDSLSRLINAEDAALWMPPKDSSDTYCREMTSEHKILDRAGNKMVWKPKYDGIANHAFDCEVLQVAAADMAKLGAIAGPSLVSPVQGVEAVEETSEPVRGSTTSWKGRY